MVTKHTSVPEQSPPQPAKSESASGAAMSAISEPSENEAMQPPVRDGQLMFAPLTEPKPEPLTDTVRGKMPLPVPSRAIEDEPPGRPLAVRVACSSPVVVGL